MKTALAIESAERHEPRGRGSQAFSLVELFVIVVVIAMFAGVTLPALVASNERVRRTQCVNNLRQIGVGWTIYQQEYGEVMPCHWHGVTYCARVNGGWASSPGNPWRTYEAYRVVPGTTNILVGSGCRVDLPDGPWNLGLLFATRLISSPEALYCPSSGRISTYFSYDYYATAPNTWPSVAPNASSDDKVRTGYNYYPQLRATEPGGIPGVLVPKPTRYGTTWADLDSRKSIVTDVHSNFGVLSHRASGSVAGLNALFPDGSVIFQNARANPEPFDHWLWGDSSYGIYIANDPVHFRYVMSLWKP